MKRIKCSILLVFVLLSSLVVSIQAQKSLKDTFKDDFMIGVALNKSQFYSEDKIALPIVKKHFNTISPENVLKWESVQPKLGEYDFRDADKYVEFGEKHGMFIIGHALVWHHQIPKEVFEDSKGNPVSREVLLGRMRDHIFTVVGRYKGRIDAWDVVNEAVGDDGKMRDSPWRKIIGEDYIEKAFEYAHEADPDAELYYNDYWIEGETKRNLTLKLVKNLIDKKIPIHGVGTQGHFNLEFPTVKEQNDTIKAFAALGMKVMITEFDIDVLPRPKGSGGAEISMTFEMQKEFDPYKKGLPDEMQKKLADRYAELFKVYLDNREHIDRVTFWNVTDKESWLNSYPVRGRTNHPLLFDREGKPKPAFDAVIEVGQKSSSKIDLTKIKSIAKGRVQDKDYNQSEVVDALIKNGKESIPFLISKLDDETQTEERVICLWNNTSVGDVALVILTDFFLDSSWEKSTIPGLTWDDFLERGDDKASTGEAILRNYIEKHGRQKIKERWQKIWEENKENIFWDETERNFKVKKS